MKSRWFNVSSDSRSWEDFYRNRWSYDYSVRSSHGVNCSMACSWEVFVKDGLICWELQKTDYPQIDPDIPNVEPRGCQRGVTASWYPYSPLRPKYPYVRKVLWDYYREERQKGKDPVEAWASIVEDEERAKKYKSARGGKAGWKRVTWDEATELVAGAQIYTIKRYGPDHIANFSPIPAMSLLSFISGHRYNNLLGGIYCSYYEWYHDLPHVSSSMFADQTENCESSDWYNGTYWIVAGSNLNMTRTADCHFLPEAKYRGAKVVVVSPNYSDVSKYADLWVPLVPGSDGAYFMACIHVILKEFYADRETPYFTEYVKKYTNLPFLVILEKDGKKYQMGRFLRASDLAEYAGEENADWKLIMMDAAGRLHLPTGSIGFRWEKEPTGNWNLQLKNAVTKEEFDPRLTLLGKEDLRAMVSFSDFTETFSIYLGKSQGKMKKAKELLREVPARKMNHCGLKSAVSGGLTLMLDVPEHGSFGPTPVGRDIVAVGPEAVSPQRLFQLRKFLPDLMRGPTLDQVHDLGRRVARLGRQKQMDVIRLDVQLQDLELVDLGAETDQLFQALFEPTLQDALAVLGDPDKVVLDVVGGVGGGSKHEESIAETAPA